VIGMPGLSTAVAEVFLMEPRSFDEMPRAIQALRERKTVILNLTMMEPDQAQRAVDFVAGGTFAIDGHQERVGESIFLFAPSCVTVTTAGSEESASPTVVSSRPAADPSEAAPSPAWGRADALG
jgi:cell division inhibitor SepF